LQALTAISAHNYGQHPQRKIAGSIRKKYLPVAVRTNPRIGDVFLFNPAGQ